MESHSGGENYLAKVLHVISARQWGNQPQSSLSVNTTEFLASHWIYKYCSLLPQSLAQASLLTTLISIGNLPLFASSATPTHPCNALRTVFSSGLLVYLLSKLNT